MTYDFFAPARSADEIVKSMEKFIADAQAGPAPQWVLVGPDCKVYASADPKVLAMVLLRAGATL